MALSGRMACGLLMGIFLLMAGVAGATTRSTVIGGAAVYSPGGWGDYAVETNGAMGFDVTAANPYVIIDFVIDLSRLQCDLLPGAQPSYACDVERDEQIRIDGEQGFSDPKLFFYLHEDEYDLRGVADARHRNTVNYSYCANVSVAPSTISSPTVGEITTGTCFVKLAPGHHTVELHVDTRLRGGFGTSPVPFSLTVAATVSQNSGTPVFAPSVSVPTAASMGGISAMAVAGDFNGDGVPDLVTTNLVDSSVSVLLGNGKGGFAPATKYGVGGGPYGVAAGDFNGDGRLDIAVVNGSDNTVSVLLNNGSGGFPAKPSYTYAVGFEPFGVFTGDFNRDGAPDLVVTNTGASTLTMLLGKGDGSFQAGATYATGSYPFSAVVADVNGDGYPDLVVENASDNTVGVLLNDKTGKFLPQITYATGNEPFGVSAGDFNGDGYADIAVANLGSNTVSVLLNDGTGKFLPAVSYATGALPASLVAADLNGDGVLDLAVANLGADSVGLLLGMGDGTFLPQTSMFAAGAQPFSLLAADFNSDGKPDLAVTSFYDNTIGILLQDTASSSTIQRVRTDPQRTQKTVPLR